MTRYILSPEAKQDLREIRTDLNKVAGPHIAQNMTSGIVRAMRLLAERPELGHFQRDLTSDPVRFWQVYDFMIVYDHASRPIGVARVLHSRRDVAAILARDRR